MEMTILLTSKFLSAAVLSFEGARALGGRGGVWGGKGVVGTSSFALMFCSFRAIESFMIFLRQVLCFLRGPEKRAKMPPLGFPFFFFDVKTSRSRLTATSRLPFSSLCF